MKRDINSFPWKKVLSKLPVGSWLKCCVIYTGVVIFSLYLVCEAIWLCHDVQGNSTPVINTFTCISSAGGKICAPTSHSTIKVIGATNTPGTRTISITPTSVGADTLGAAAAVNSAFVNYTSNSIGGGRATKNYVTSAQTTLYYSPTAPPSPTAYNPLWMDTSTSPPTLKVRNGANSAWISVGTFNDTGNVFIAANSALLGGFAASQAPGANQIPVFDSHGYYPAFANFSSGISVPTKSATDNTTAAASTAQVQAAIAAQILAPTSWTPYIQIGAANTGITYTTQTGTYITLGRMVFAQFEIVLSNKGALTGAVTVRGLPADLNIDVSRGFASSYSNFSGLTGVLLLYGQELEGVNSVNVSQSGATGNVSVHDSNLTNISTIYGTLVYSH